MSGLSKTKLNELKQSKNFTLFEISEKTGIPKSTIDKIFGGFNKNPSIDSLLKIAKVLDCGVDDFFEYEIEPSSPFSVDRNMYIICNSLCENRELKYLFELTKSLKTEDIVLLQNIAQRLQ